MKRPYEMDALNTNPRSYIYRICECYYHKKKLVEMYPLIEFYIYSKLSKNTIYQILQFLKINMYLKQNVTCILKEPKAQLQILHHKIKKKINKNTKSPKNIIKPKHSPKYFHVQKKTITNFKWKNSSHDTVRILINVCTAKLIISTQSNGVTVKST